MKIQEEMFAKAKSVRELAHAPYSHFLVGACIYTTDRHFYVGCNVENASYGLGLCAEAAAICQMIAGGEQQVQEVLIIGSGSILCTPCGACRQRLLEFSKPNTLIHMANQQGIQKTMTLEQLLPYAFGPHNLESRND